MKRRATGALFQFLVLSSQFSLLAILSLLAAGCVERTLMLRSDPPGAMVVVNGRDAGIAPVKVRFETYGVFEVVMSCPRRHRLREEVPVKPPWYEQMPLDFFAEIVWPFTIHDDHEATLTLKPLEEGSEAGIDQREQKLREQVERGEEAAPKTAPEGLPAGRQAGK